MKSALLIAGVIAIALNTGCKKNETDPNDGGTTKLLQKYTSTQYHDTISFGYNTIGQMIRSEGSEDRSTFEFTGNQLTYKEFRKTENRTTATATFNVNAQGNVVSGQGTFSYNLNAPYTAQFTFEYDGSGNLIKRTDARSDGNTWSYEFTWTNGDITTIKWINNGALYLTQTIAYYTDKEDKNKVDWDKFLSGTNSFFGNSNSHLRKHQQVVFAPGSTVTQEYSYDYTLGADGYPTMSEVTGITTPGTDVITYYYQ